MTELEEYLKVAVDAGMYKMVISKPIGKDNFRKIVVERKEKFYQAACYTEQQVFHQNIKPNEAVDAIFRLISGKYMQINAWDGSREHIILISKKGNVSYRSQRQEPGDAKPGNDSHNRKKKYLLNQDTVIPPLVDMGIFTSEGKIVRSMYDKFRQINRFLETVEDVMRDYPKERLNIIDFGCGKSYLTFILYYYFSEVKKLDVHIIGLDLKAEVIENCNKAAKKYGYENLRFELGDINGYKAPFPVDMVVTLHACDTATDYALYNAIQWDAKMIFSVLCCQHELNRQIQTEQFSLLTRYGIVKERFSALATDAIRANLLEACGYKTQLLEFIDFSHTPKNILIRSVQKKIVPRAVKQRYLREVERLMEEFHFTPTLYQLLQEAGRI